MNVSGAFNLLFRPGLRKDFRDSYEAYAPEWSQWLKAETMSMPELAATIMAGPSRMLEMGDGESVTYQQIKIGPKVMGVDREFGIGISLSKKAVEDDQYGRLKNAAKYMAEAARMTQEYRSAALLDDATTGTDFLGIDGLPLLSNNHTYLNAGGTWSNLTTIGLSVTGVTALTDLAETQKNHNGDPMKVNLDRIIIGAGAGQYNRALQIFGSQLEPFTAENQDNPIHKRFGGISIITSRFKSNPRSYFMVDSKLNDTMMATRRPIQQEDDFDFNTGAALYKATTRFLVWFVDPRGWYGAIPT